MAYRIRSDRAARGHGTLIGMRIATWNVNSIRARLDRVVQWLQDSDVDVLAMQETKCRDDQFPALIFESIGYESVSHGTSQWNGVAIVSRVGITDIERSFPGQPTWGDPPELETRALGATCGGVRIWSVYVPNGRQLGHPHLAYKLTWLAALRAAGEGWLAADPSVQVALMGDWNIAPYDDDVWDIGLFATSTHVSAPERSAFFALTEAGFTDVVRPYTPGPGVYTYWDFTQLRFPRREGMRIDVCLACPALATRVSGAAIDRQARKGKGASDHAPVVVDIS
jgi:exodeoxyribonuclease-3